MGFEPTPEPWLFWADSQPIREMPCVSRCLGLRRAKAEQTRGRRLGDRVIPHRSPWPFTHSTASASALFSLCSNNTLTQYPTACKASRRNKPFKGRSTASARFSRVIRAKMAFAESGCAEMFGFTNENERSTDCTPAPRLALCPMPCRHYNLPSQILQGNVIPNLQVGEVRCGGYRW